jgi:hypothetical protein
MSSYLSFFLCSLLYLPFYPYFLPNFPFSFSIPFTPLLIYLVLTAEFYYPSHQNLSFINEIKDGKRFILQKQSTFWPCFFPNESTLRYFALFTRLFQQLFSLPTFLFYFIYDHLSTGWATTLAPALGLAAITCIPTI